jgi:hypothetical protein
VSKLVLTFAVPLYRQREYVGQYTGSSYLLGGYASQAFKSKKLLKEFPFEPLIVILIWITHLIKRLYYSSIA